MSSDPPPDSMQELPDAAPHMPTSASQLSSVAGDFALPDGLGLTQGSAAGEGEGGEGGGGENLIDALRQAWINENAAPELLFYELDTVSEVRAAVEQRQSQIETLGRESDMHFVCSLLQMELERIKFVMHQYHRVRLSKIEKYATFILANQQQDRCSPHELNFLKGLANSTLAAQCSHAARSCSMQTSRSLMPLLSSLALLPSYVDLLQRHLHDSFLSSLPGRLSDWIPPGKTDAPEILKPDTHNRFVTFRVKEAVPSYALKESDRVAQRSACTAA